MEEAKARATQMEKTMKWWSDCTASWREKWSQVRDERNKAREDLKHLRQKLEGVQNQNTSLLSENKNLQSELEAQIQKNQKNQQLLQKSSVPSKTTLRQNPSELPQNQAGVVERSLGVQCFFSDQILYGGRTDSACNTDSANQSFCDEKTVLTLKKTLDTTLIQLKEQSEINRELSRSCNEKQEEISILTAKCKELEAFQGVAHEEIEDLKSIQDYHSCEEKVDELQAKVNELHSKCTEAEAENERLNSAKEALEHELSKVKIEMENAQTNFNQSRLESDCAKNDQDEQVMMQLREAVEELDTVKKKNQELEEAMKRLKMTDQTEKNVTKLKLRKTVSV